MLRVLVTALLVAGCYSPSIRDCSIACGADGSCPSGASCGADGLCHVGGTSSCPGPEGPPDARRGAPDARAARCGDGVVTPPETCDVAIPAGAEGACPTGCDDGDACTVDTLVGDGCDASCSHTPIVHFADGDGCCPAGGAAYQDSDCPSVCGNGVVEPGEQCDGGPDCSPSCTLVQPALTAFRIDSLVLQDPHVFPDYLICLGDQTNALNRVLADRLNGDTSPTDGKLDTSPVLVFQAFQTQPGASMAVDVVFASCTAPAATTTCDGAGAPRDAATARNRAGGLCVDLSRLESTTNPAYDRSDIDRPAAPCFATEPTSLVLDAGGAQIPLTDARLAGVFSSAGITDGLLSGFVSQADADVIVVQLPDPLAISVPLGSLLAGDPSCCITDANKDGVIDHDDRDVGPDGRTVGWYFYFNFTAVLVSYVE
jgi:hypothetical protein